MSLPEPREKTRSTPGLVEPVEKETTRDQQKQHKEEADGKVQDQQEPVEQGRRPNTQSKLHSTGTQLLGDEEHDVLAQHQDKCKSCRATTQDPRPSPRCFISWVQDLSSIRTTLGHHGWCCWFLVLWGVLFDRSAGGSQGNLLEEFLSF